MSEGFKDLDGEAVLHLTEDERRSIVHPTESPRQSKKIYRELDVNGVDQRIAFRTQVIACDTGGNLARSVCDAIRTPQGLQSADKLAVQLSGPRVLHSLYLPATRQELETIATLVQTAVVPDHIGNYRTLAAKALAREIHLTQQDQIAAGATPEEVLKRTRTGLAVYPGIATLDDTTLRQILTQTMTGTTINFENLKKIYNTAADLGDDNLPPRRGLSNELNKKLAATTHMYLLEAAENLILADLVRITPHSLDIASTNDRADVVQKIMLARVDHYLATHSEEGTAPELATLMVEIFFSKRIHHADPQARVKDIVYKLIKQKHTLAASEFLLQAQKTRLFVLTGNSVQYYVDAGFDLSDAKRLVHDHVNAMNTHNQQLRFRPPLDVISDQTTNLQILMGTFNMGTIAYRCLQYAAQTSRDSYEQIHPPSETVTYASVNTGSGERFLKAMTSRSHYLYGKERFELIKTALRGLDNICLTTIDDPHLRSADPSEDPEPRKHFDHFLQAAERKVGKKLRATRVCGWDRLLDSSPRADAIKLIGRGANLQQLFRDRDLLKQLEKNFPHTEITLILAQGIAGISSTWVQKVVTDYLLTPTSDRVNKARKRELYNLFQSTMHPENVPKVLARLEELIVQHKNL